jgi:hypothetical protein
MQCAKTDRFMVGNNDPRARLFTPQDHVTSTLTRDTKSDTLKRPSKILAGYIGREFSHYPGTWSSTNSFPASLGHGVACGEAILDVQFSSFANIRHYFGASFSLGDATRQGRDDCNVASIGSCSRITV